MQNAKRKRASEKKWIGVNKTPCGDGFNVTYYGVKNSRGCDISTLCKSILSVKATVTRWSNKFGKPDRIVCPQLPDGTYLV